MNKELLLVLPRNERGFWGKVPRGKAGFVRLSLPAMAALTPSDWKVTIHDARALNLCLYLSLQFAFKTSSLAGKGPLDIQWSNALESQERRKRFILGYRACASQICETVSIEQVQYSSGRTE